jgi:hypothetical protein
MATSTRLVVLGLCGLGACSTRYLPPPAIPERVAPRADYPAPPLRQGEGQVTFDVVGERARVERITSRIQNVNLSAGMTLGRRGVNTLSPTTQYTLAPLCETPCTVNLPLGPHEILFSSTDPSSSRASTVFVQSETTPTIVRHALGVQTTDLGGLIGSIVMGGFSLGALLTGGALLLVHAPSNPSTDGFDTAGFITLGVGAALATGAVLLGLSSRPTQQPGATVQWVR